MRSVALHLRDATYEEVASFLQHLYPMQKGPPWICDIAGDACLYIDVYSNAQEELGPQAWEELVAALGKEPSVSVLANISGRHSGDDQVREFVVKSLARFHGVAQDDYTDHCWTVEEILSGRVVEGHGFFDYRSGNGVPGAKESE